MSKVTKEDPRLGNVELKFSEVVPRVPKVVPEPLSSTLRPLRMLNLAEQWGWTGNDTETHLGKLLKQMIDESDPKLPFGTSNWIEALLHGLEIECNFIIDFPLMFLGDVYLHKSFGLKTHQPSLGEWEKYKEIIIWRDMLLAGHTLPPTQLRQTAQWQSPLGLQRNFSNVERLETKMDILLPQPSGESCILATLPSNRWFYPLPSKEKTKPTSSITAIHHTPSAFVLEE
ncbi:hypothetical protein CK203_047431 [Vitis vinifera]|uniref:Uncharacterized protein n=1 Tax=Vitis vinifera TaxID=29760 RepID=A0A438G220_VITVI|nr:hypothetical protein CK203_047431 [Vitis vinifera]